MKHAHLCMTDRSVPYAILKREIKAEDEYVLTLHDNVFRVWMSIDTWPWWVEVMIPYRAVDPQNPNTIRFAEARFRYAVNKFNK